MSQAYYRTTAQKKVKTFVWEIKSWPRRPRFYVCTKIEMPTTSPLNRNMALNVHIHCIDSFWHDPSFFSYRHFNCQKMLGSHLWKRCIHWLTTMYMYLDQLCNLFSTFQVITQTHPPYNLVTDVGKVWIKLGLSLTSLKVIVLLKSDVEHTVHFR